MRTVLLVLYRVHLPLYLYKCVFTLSIEVKPLIIKCNVVTIAIDTANCITLVGGACKRPSTALTVEIHTDKKLN